MYKGGYSQIQSLISLINLVLFYLKHEEGETIYDKLHVLLGISDALIIVLEDECYKMDQASEQVAR
jgi:hypothetical protein